MGKGKKGKALFSILGFAFGAGVFSHGAFQFGCTTAISGGLYGASLAGTLWSTFNKPDVPSYGDGGVQRFDKAMNTLSSTAAIPVIYGERKWGGNQTYHKPNPELNMLQKHVLLCEGGIEGIKSVSANDLLVPDTPQQPGTIFTIRNVKYEDATVAVWGTGHPTGNDKVMRLIANGKTTDIIMAHYSDADRSDLFEYNVNISSLIAYINRLGDGWQAYPYATAGTTQSPENIYDIPKQNCYENPVAALVSGPRGETKYTLHDCEPPENYEEVGSYKNCAWLDMKMAVSDELNGNPNISALIQGKKVLDLRTGQVEYSTNPAMCLLDFLLSKRYGLGKWIDMDNIDTEAWKEAADYCDERIDFKNADGTVEKAKRYELNMVIDSRKSTIDWVGDMLSNFCGYLVITGDKIALRIERATQVCYAFSDDNIVDDISISQDLLKETPNKYEISFVDPLNNWNTAKCIVENTADQKERQKIITKSVELEGVTSQHQALRLGRFYRDFNTLCNLTISFKTAMQAAHLEPGDVVSVSWKDVFKGALFRIIEIQETNEGTFQIKARLYNDTIYNDDLGASLQYYNYTSVATLNHPMYVTNLYIREQYNKLGDGIFGNELEISFAHTDVYFDHAEIYLLADNPNIDEIEVSWGDLEGSIDSIDQSSKVWKYMGNALDMLVVKNAVAGLTYTFKAVSVSRSGRKSNFANSPTVSHTVGGCTLVPSAPSGLSIAFTNTCTISWNAVRDASFYELKCGSMLMKTKDTFVTAPLKNRHGVLQLYAVNDNGRSSPAELEYFKPSPSAPKGVKLSAVFQGVMVATEAFPMYIQGINVHLDDGISEQVIFSPNNRCSPCLEAGIYKIQVGFVDLFGEGVLSDPVQYVLKPTLDPELLAGESMSLEKMDQAIKDAIAKAQQSVSMDEFKKELDALKDSIKELDDAKVSYVEFTDKYNKLVQVDGDLKSLIKQTADSITSTVSANKAAQDKVNASVTKDISQIKQNADSILSIVQKNRTDQDGVNTNLVSLIKQTADSITSTVTANKSAQDKVNSLVTSDISQIRQSADSITSTVQQNKTAQDGVNKSLSSQITQTAGQISSVVTELNKPANQCGYTAIVQTQNAIQLRAEKDKLISLINVCPEAITIDGKYIHVTGNTKFDNNVIVERMLSANAVTADKIASGEITSDKIKVGSITADSIKVGTITADNIDLNGVVDEIQKRMKGNVVVTTGSCSLGRLYTVPVPSGFTESQCTVFAVCTEWIDNGDFGTCYSYSFGSSSRRYARSLLGIPTNERPGIVLAETVWWIQIAQK